MQTKTENPFGCSEQESEYGDHVIIDGLIIIIIIGGGSSIVIIVTNNII